jgi:hypothetical protein
MPQCADRVAQEASRGRLQSGEQRRELSHDVLLGQAEPQSWTGRPYSSCCGEDKGQTPPGSDPFWCRRIRACARSWWLRTISSLFSSSDASLAPKARSSCRLETSSAMCSCSSSSLYTPKGSLPEAVDRMWKVARMGRNVRPSESRKPCGNPRPCGRPFDLARLVASRR